MNSSPEYTLPVDNTTVHYAYRDACARTDNLSAMRITQRDIVENTQVPESHVSKFFAGMIKNTNTTNLAEMAQYINLRFGKVVISLDNLYGISSVPPDEVYAGAELDGAGSVCSIPGKAGGESPGANEELIILTEENKRLAEELSRTKEYERQIRELKDDSIARLDKALKARRPLVWALLTLNFIMAIIVVAYLSVDISAPTIGFFRGTLSVPGLAILVIVVLALIALVIFVIKEIIEAKKK